MISLYLLGEREGTAGLGLGCAMGSGASQLASEAAHLPLAQHIGVIDHLTWGSRSTKSHSTPFSWLALQSLHTCVPLRYAVSLHQPNTLQQLRKSQSAEVVQFFKRGHRDAFAAHTPEEQQYGWSSVQAVMHEYLTAPAGALHSPASAAQQTSTNSVLMPRVHTCPGYSVQRLWQTRASPTQVTQRRR